MVSDYLSVYDLNIVYNITSGNRVTSGRVF